MPINLVSWLSNEFGDGETEPVLDYWSVELTVRIPNIRPDQKCTRGRAIEWAKDELRKNALFGVDDYEFTDAVAKREEI